MNEIVSTFLQIKDDLLMRFHALRSDADGLGNNIVNTYARKSALEPIKEQINLQNDCIVETADNVETLNHNVENTKSEVKGVQGKQHTDEIEIAELKSLLANASLRIAELEEKVQLNVKNKGVFASEKALNAIVPSVGDSAIVIAPNLSTTENPEEYYGSAYLGQKEEHMGDWQSNYKSALGCVYKVKNVLYRVERDVEVFMLVDPHHTELELVEDGIISHIVLNDNAYPYVCEVDGKWKMINRNIPSIEVAENTPSSKVMDGELTQEEINLTARVNSILGNSNNDAIVHTIYKLVDAVNAIQKNGVFVGDMKYIYINKPSTTGYQVTGDLHNNLLDISPMPIILS